MQKTTIQGPVYLVPRVLAYFVHYLYTGHVYPLLPVNP